MALLDFIYLGEITIQEDHLYEFMTIAEEYRIKGLSTGKLDSMIPKYEEEDMDLIQKDERREIDNSNQFNIDEKNTHQ